MEGGEPGVGGGLPGTEPMMGAPAAAVPGAVPAGGGGLPGT